MELKQYQKRVIGDISDYIRLLSDTKSIEAAYKQFWEERGIQVSSEKMPPYHNNLPGVPHVCLKVPTGGGKTFIACNAIKPIFDGLPATKARVVVWLVPTDSILTQTIQNLKDSNNPYRQKINADFNNKVEVYTKEELLNGQNFNISAVCEQLSIMVLSYDSFRGGTKEALKAKRENSNLAPMAKALGTPMVPVEDADETALLQIINQLSPLVIVDESHHATSVLSRKMLSDFNPCFVLELTATPTKDSNVISYVDAVQLKRESMVKLPVIVYNRNSMKDVMVDAIDLRNRLEEQAKEERENSGYYVRPIVLFQAQPRGKEDNTTFEKLKDKLVEAGISRNEIAIKTGEINELNKVDLLSEKCAIRYIITVNALKEGWDCPFAYILASLANKTSQIDVEQIVGRVLRQPYTHYFKTHPVLNMSYVLTSSVDFSNTLSGIVKGLNGAGFSDKDYRVGEIKEQETVLYEFGEQTSLFGNEHNVLREQDTIYGTEVKSENNELAEEEQTEKEDFLNFNSSEIGNEIAARITGDSAAVAMQTTADALLFEAEKQQNAFEDAIAEDEDKPLANLPDEVRNMVDCYHMNSEYIDSVSKLRLPELSLKIEDSFIVDGNYVKLEKEHLAEGFTLKGKSYDIDFDRADDQIAKVDINDIDGSIPKVFKMSDADQRYFKEQFLHLNSDKKLATCKEILFRQIEKIDAIESNDLKNYIDLIVDNMDKATVDALEKSPMRFAMRIKERVTKLLEEHCQKTFNEWLETGKISCIPTYTFPKTISPMKSISMFGGSLYKAEEEVNGFENEMLMTITSLVGKNIEWWHRNIAKRGFCINGYINHYPDFILKTKSGKIVLIETKGDHLLNEETMQKLAIGRAWQQVAGPNYRYYLVFQSKEIKLQGAYHFDGFIDILKQL